MKSNLLMCFFMDHAFDVTSSEKSLPNPVSKRVSPLFSSSFIA